MGWKSPRMFSPRKARRDTVTTAASWERISDPTALPRLASGLEPRMTPAA
jgi:hypothetical protein